MDKRGLDTHGATRARVAHALFFAGLTLAAVACTRVRSPADEAADLERTRCGQGVEEASLTPVFAAIEGVEPLYDVAADEDLLGRQEEIIGAVVLVRPLQGVTAEWLDRALECHGARRVLGRVPEIPNDPFWMPGGLVDIDVRPGHDRFRVLVRGETRADARTILERAEAFAGGAR